MPMKQRRKARNSLPNNNLSNLLYIMGKNKSTYNKLPLTHILTIVGLGLTALGGAFALGIYVERAIVIAERNDIVLKLNEEKETMRSEYETEIHNLREKIYDLQDKLLEKNSNTHE